MIPTYDVVPEIEGDSKLLRVLTARDIVDGFSLVRDYAPLIDITWAEAEDCVAAESRWLQLAAHAADPEQFDEILYSAPDEEAPGDFDWLFRWNDVGVAGLVLALSAASFATCYSCRGHAATGGRPIPQVRFGTEPERLNQLIPYIGDAGCGALVDNDGLVTVYAQSVAEMNRLARMIVAAREVFDVLDAPPWQAVALEALAAGDDFDWGDAVFG